MVFRDHFSVPHEYIIYIGEKKQNKKTQTQHTAYHSLIIWGNNKRRKSQTESLTVRETWVVRESAVKPGERLRSLLLTRQCVGTHLKIG